MLVSVMPGATTTVRDLATDFADFAGRVLFASAVGTGSTVGAKLATDASTPGGPVNAAAAVAPAGVSVVLVGAPASASFDSFMRSLSRVPRRTCAVVM